MNKKIRVLILTGILITSLSLKVLADPYAPDTPDIPAGEVQSTNIDNEQNKINNNKIQIEKNKIEYEKAIKEINDVETRIQKLDREIENMMIKIQDANKRIDSTNEKITLAQLELSKAEDEMKREKSLFNKRAKNLYMNGKDNYIEIVLDSKGLHDFISRIENLRAIVEYDREITAQIKEKKAKINQRKEDLEIKRKESITLKNDLQKDLDILNTAKAEQEPLIKKAEEKKKQYENIINTYESEIKKSKAQIDMLMRNSRGGAALDVQYEVPKSGPAAERAIAVARQFIGSWYVWGGARPQQKDTSGKWMVPKFRGDQSYGGFDCSGLVQFAYGQVGINLSRTTFTQINEGMPVGKSQLQPGDLVFFGNISAPHHIGIYIGNGEYLHAPQTGDRIKISNLWSRGDFCAARRVAY
ncbi:C40 family peptidase [Hathewaya histolytica]|uniref:Cell wall-associated hydrolase, invasion-associated protein n=1 Tax=Hathewaya histolytica TaxID=1498 RepID=A0A4U9QVG7_HATHI|nr:C40 family peptidase [Hathewaya histolytica]VTQ82605.1 cell wall-associated hydrolase, invasion-associated protein [Hathewaya histolytica]